MSNSEVEFDRAAGRFAAHTQQVSILHNLSLVVASIDNARSFSHPLLPAVLTLQPARASPRNSEIRREPQDALWVAAEDRGSRVG
ncbi:hypothetical protein RRG08_042341 [Elysia crispata]|uniref:Uncharacterized protein n=1 Tax=Elysia crispata TaxID=231223 RepID=A0AAE1AIW0_9GAST|nr:hypothetical protein RRG08_042341 [Elysia crispata]